MLFSPVQVQAVDEKTRLMLFKLVSGGWLETIGGVLATGKESVVLHARGGPVPLPNPKIVRERARTSNAAARPDGERQAAPAPAGHESDPDDDLDDDDDDDWEDLELLEPAAANVGVGVGGAASSSNADAPSVASSQSQPSAPERYLPRDCAIKVFKTSLSTFKYEYSSRGSALLFPEFQIPPA